MKNNFSKSFFVALIVGVLTVFIGFYSYNKLYTYDNQSIEEILSAAQGGNRDAQFQMGLSAYGDKKFNEAFEWYSKSAEQGHAMANNNLGLMYMKGQFVDKDVNEAIQKYKRAVELGSPIAASNLGNFYYNKENFSKAYKWFVKAAEMGNSPSQVQMGVFYLKGYGVDKDYSLAKEWFEKAVEQKNDWAFHYLGNIYEQGLGVKQNLELASSYYYQAAINGNLNSKEYLKTFEADCLNDEMIDKTQVEACILSQIVPNVSEENQPENFIESLEIREINKNLEAQYDFYIKDYNKFLEDEEKFQSLLVADNKKFVKSKYEISDFDLNSTTMIMQQLGGGSLAKLYCGTHGCSHNFYYVENGEVNFIKTITFTSFYKVTCNNNDFLILRGGGSAGITIKEYAIWDFQAADLKKIGETNSFQIKKICEEILNIQGE